MISKEPSSSLKKKQKSVISWELYSFLFSSCIVWASASTLEGELLCAIFMYYLFCINFNWNFIST